MEKRQDSYWMECTLDEKVDQKVSEYLRNHHAEYRSTKQRIKEVIEQHPNVQSVFETKDAVTLTAEEHEVLHTYFQLESYVELIEREYHFYMGQSMMFSYGSMLAQIRKDFFDSDGEMKEHLLDLIKDSRTDELEEGLQKESQEYQNAIEEVTQYEAQLQNMSLSKEVRKQIDRYVSAVNRRWILCGDFLYKAGMKDVLMLLENR